MRIHILLEFETVTDFKHGWSYYLLPVPIYQKPIKLPILIRLKIYLVNLFDLCFFPFSYTVRQTTDFCYFESISSLESWRKKNKFVLKLTQSLFLNIERIALKN